MRIVELKDVMKSIGFEEVKADRECCYWEKRVEYESELREDWEDNDCEVLEVYGFCEELFDDGGEGELTDDSNFEIAQIRVKHSDIVDDYGVTINNCKRLISVIEGVRNQLIERGVKFSKECSFDSCTSNMAIYDKYNIVI